MTGSEQRTFSGIVLAIDPGNTHSGFVLYDASDRTVLMKGKVDNEHLLVALRSGEFEGATDLAFEMAESFGAKVWDQVFKAVLWSGRFVEAWASTTSLPSSPIYRRDVKAHVAGSARAKDGQIRNCLLERWGGKEKAIGTKKEPGPLHGVTADAWAALAIAVTFAERGVRP